MVPRLRVHRRSHGRRLRARQQHYECRRCHVNAISEGGATLCRAPLPAAKGYRRWRRCTGRAGLRFFADPPCAYSGRYCRAVTGCCFDRCHLDFAEFGSARHIDRSAACQRSDLLGPAAPTSAGLSLPVISFPDELLRLPLTRSAGSYGSRRAPARTTGADERSTSTRLSTHSRRRRPVPNAAFPASSGSTMVRFVHDATDDWFLRRPSFVTDLFLRCRSSQKSIRTTQPTHYRHGKLTLILPPLALRSSCMTSISGNEQSRRRVADPVARQ